MRFDGSELPTQASVEEYIWATATITTDTYMGVPNICEVKKNY